jgi:uncharacterized protein (DUF2062 family)
VGSSRLVAYREQAQAALRAAFTEDYPPHVTATSFALGLFLVALPNLGLSVLVLGGIAYRYEWPNPRALTASVVVLNPFVKGAVYVVSFGLGTALLGPVSGVSRSEVTLSAGPGVLARLFVGNAIVAALFAGVGYVVALYGVSAVRKYSDGTAA